MEPTALFFVCVCVVCATNKTKPSHPTPFRAGFGLTTVHDSSFVFVVRPRDTRARTGDGPGGTDGRGGATLTLTTTTTTTMIAQHVSAKASYAAVSGLNKSRGARAVRARRAIARSIDSIPGR